MRPPIASSAAIVAAIALLSIAPVPSARAAGADTVGTGISYPQCGTDPPHSPFAIVGVNGGVVFTANPCLAQQVAWAGIDRVQLYANTGNAGPGVSAHWPTGQTSPRICLASAPDTAGCAYDHGWNAAADSYRDAVGAFRSLGTSRSPASVPWWLDVEIANSWRADTSLNVADLAGAVAFLQSVGVPSVGFYSTAYQWDIITGGTRAFRAHPSWVAGATDLADARSGCSESGFTGGPVDLVQFVPNDLDLDIACRPVLPPVAPAKPRVAAVSHPAPRPTPRPHRATAPVPSPRRLPTAAQRAEKRSAGASFPAVSPSATSAASRAVGRRPLPIPPLSVPLAVLASGGPTLAIHDSRPAIDTVSPVMASAAPSTAPAFPVAVLVVAASAVGLVVSGRRAR